MIACSLKHGMSDPRLTPYKNSSRSFRTWYDSFWDGSGGVVVVVVIVVAVVAVVGGVGGGGGGS